MSKEVILKATEISKQYRLGTVGTGTITHDLNRWWARIRGKEDPYLKIGEVNDRSVKSTSEYVWALKNIDFEVYQGEVLGIIGKNGAGKSTLLKILSRVTAPTTGSIKTKGRIASLLEVGTGFNGEMTGRENIFLNGAILGMTKKEIQSKIAEIIEFSGCQRYIDTPVKRYSSGMTVRLAFAVAAFLEPEILVIDEVLAVGDAEFQKKAIGKMQDISRGEGRTVIFVSHNMAAVKSLCTRGIVMEHGGIVFEGGIDESVDFYLQTSQYEGYVGEYSNINVEESGVLNIQLLDKNNLVRNEFGFDDPFKLKVRLKIAEKHLVAYLGFVVADYNERNIFTSDISLASIISKEGIYEFEIKIPSKILLPNRFEVNFALHIPNIHFIEYLKKCISFEVVETGSDLYQFADADNGCVMINCTWDIVV